MLRPYGGCGLTGDADAAGDAGDADAAGDAGDAGAIREAGTIIAFLARNIALESETA